jgi:hypothetical protein
VHGGAEGHGGGKQAYRAVKAEEVFFAVLLGLTGERCGPSQCAAVCIMYTQVIRYSGCIVPLSF